MSEGSTPPTADGARKLAAIMFTDIVGFSRQMGADEARMLQRLAVHNQLVRRAVAEHHGQVIKTIGDAFLVDFPSVVNAVQCAQHIQQQFKLHNAEKETSEQIHVRIGIHSGDVVQQDGDVFGDGVNVASRLQGIAEPDTICLSQIVYQEVEKKLALGRVVSLGRPKLKNIVQRFPVYALLPDAPSGFRQRFRVQRLKLSRRVRPVHWLSAAGLLLVAGTLFTVHYLPLLRFLLSPPRPSAPNTEPLTEALPLPDKPSLITLPFANISNDPSQDYFSDGITEDITTDLSKLSGLFVISRDTAFTYKGKAVKIQEISRELGVQYVLEGSVRKAGDQVRVTAQLIDAVNDRHLWAERYDRPLKDIFAVQDEIRQKIVTTLKLQLSVWEKGFLVHKTTNNLEAYDYYLRGLQSFWRFTKEANAQARQMYEKALEFDPQYASAYASLSMTYIFDRLLQWSRDPQALRQATETAQKAIVLDDSLPFAHTAMGWAYLWEKHHDQAITEIERVLALDPNSAQAYYLLGHFLVYAGQPEKTVDLVQKAMRLNPRYPSVYLLTMGNGYFFTGRYEEALKAYKTAATAIPNLLTAHVGLAMTYVELEREDKARAEGAEILRLNPLFSLELLKQTLPLKYPAMLEHILTNLRKAGLK